MSFKCLGEHCCYYMRKVCTSAFPHVWPIRMEKDNQKETLNIDSEHIIYTGSIHRITLPYATTAELLHNRQFQSTLKTWESPSCFFSPQNWPRALIKQLSDVTQGGQNHFHLYLLTHFNTIPIQQILPRPLSVAFFVYLWVVLILFFKLRFVLLYCITRDFRYYCLNKSFAFIILCVTEAHLYCVTFSGFNPDTELSVFLSPCPL